ncbi:hypothetical protein OROGR_014189 [Orobanche gracilis]
MARGGYDFVVVREMKRKLEERKKEASKSGEDVIIDPPSPTSRHQMWKLGRQKRSGGLSSDAAREIVTKIDELEAHCTQSNFTPERRHDILVEAIGRPEHPGRVRDYFGHLHTFGQTLESLGAHSQQPHTDLRTPDDNHVTRASTKGSCADDVSGPSGGRTPPVDTGRFGYYVDERRPCLGAIGRVHHGDFTLHCAPLPAHLVKVIVVEVVDGCAEDPIPTKEQNIERPEPPKKHARQDDRSSHSDTLKELFSVTATLFTDPFQVPWDTAPFGCGGDDVPLYISYNDLLEIIQDKHWLSLSILQFWTL